MRARYIRVSTGEQNIARQEAQGHPNEKSYIDYISGSTKLEDRPNGKKLLQDIKDGLIKYVTVQAVDRLGRNTSDVILMIELFEEYNVTLRIDSLGLESRIDGKPNDVFKLITSILSVTAQMEKSIMTERQKAGIEAARKRGDVYKGRLKGTVEDDADFLKKHKRTIKVLNNNKNKSLREIAKLVSDDSSKKNEANFYKVSPNTVRKIKSILNAKNNTPTL